MFDFDVGKLVLVGIVALVVIPSKDLPRVLRQVGQAVGKMRRMATEFQSQFMDAMREADVADLKKELDKTTSAIGLDTAFDPLKDAHEQIVKAIESDPTSAAAASTVDALPPEVSEVAPPAETMDLAQPPVGATIEAGEENALEPPFPATDKLAPVVEPAAVHAPAPAHENAATGGHA